MKIETNLVKTNFFKHVQIQPLKEKISLLEEQIATKMEMKSILNGNS